MSIIQILRMSVELHAADTNTFLMLSQEEYRNHKKSWNLGSLESDCFIDSEYYSKGLKDIRLLCMLCMVATLYAVTKVFFSLLRKHHLLGHLFGLVVL